MQAPRDPFQPGGSMYDYERREGSRHRSLDPDTSRLSSDQERRRYNHYRGGVGESWGLAEFTGYERRRNREDRMRRADSRAEGRRSREYDW